MNETILGFHIVVATTIAAFIVGVLAVFLSPLARVPAETCLFPSLLPMIPGMYAYRSLGGLVMCLYQGNQQGFDHYFYIFTSNGLTCLFILLGMVVGAIIPIFMLKKISFSSTRNRRSRRGLTTVR